MGYVSWCGLDLVIEFNANNNQRTRRKNSTMLLGKGGNESK